MMHEISLCIQIKLKLVESGINNAQSIEVRSWEVLELLINLLLKVAFWLFIYKCRNFRFKVLGFC